MMWWPEQNVGAVILTNADAGVNLRGPFKRRLMGIMFDGEAQALASADANAKGGRLVASDTSQSTRSATYEEE